MSGLNPFICFTVCLISSILCDWTFYTQRERVCVQKPESNESNTENSIARLINQADACVCVYVRRKGFELYTFASALIRVLFSFFFHLFLQFENIITVYFFLLLLLPLLYSFVSILYLSVSFVELVLLQSIPKCISCIH